MPKVAQLIQLDLGQGWRAEVEQRLAVNVTESRKEPGCHRFELAADKDNPDRLWIWEEFADQAALDAHYQTNHFMTWKAWLSALPDGAVTRTRTALTPLL